MQRVTVKTADGAHYVSMKFNQMRHIEVFSMAGGAMRHRDERHLQRISVFLTFCHTGPCRDPPEARCSTGSPVLEHRGVEDIIDVDQLSDIISAR